jgi:dipeptidyl aminopeptidase/acylaminoacyl peptidase
MGGSYGGYATLAGLTFTPDQFACGVDIVGPSNLQTLLKTIPAYWEAIKTQFYKRMGDPNTEAGRKLLDERSPLYSADKIKRPLLIGQGANDPRVNVAESEQIVKAMKAKGIPVTYIVFPDEGHGFARPVNSIAFNAAAENFLSGCLGGRAEPVGNTLATSSAKVEEGAALIPGLAPR